MERPLNKPEKRTKYINSLCKLIRTESIKNRRPKKRSKRKKLTSEWILQRHNQNGTERHPTRTEWKMATENKREVTWCFMPNQPVRLYEGSDRVREVLYKKQLQCRQIQENDCIYRQRSAARRKPKTEASPGEFLEWNIGERAGRQKPDARNEWKGWSSLV